MNTENPIKVIYTDRSSIFAGAEQCLATLLEYTDRNEVDPTICFDVPLPHQSRYEPAGVRTVFRFNRSPAWMLSRRWGRPVRGVGRVEQRIMARRLRRLLCSSRTDVLHVNLLRSASYWDLAVAKRLGLRTVGHMRSLGSQVRVRDETLAFCDAVVCVSSRVRRDVDAWGSRIGTKLIYDPIHADQFVYSGGRNAARSALNLPTDARVLCSVAALEPRKGHDIAIESHARLLSDFPNAMLVIAGGPVEKSSDDGGRLRELSKRLGTTERVRFLGHVSNVAEVYAAADVVYALSRDGEAFGRVAPEAAAAGRPVIGTNVGATPEVVRHGETGILVEPNTIDDVVRWSGRLLREKDMARRLGEQGRRFVAERFSPVFHAAGVAGLYRSLMDSPELQNSVHVLKTEAN